jgi:hypothetical protein
VKFQEPTVGGLTGAQLSQLRKIECTTEICEICESEDD